jgi:hypothetical protein
MQRVAIVGTTGAGKTVLAQQLAIRIDAVHVDLDALHWEPGWQEAPRDIFRARVVEALQDERWVVTGNYSKARGLIWTKADTLIWLDYGLSIFIGCCAGRSSESTPKKICGARAIETWRKQFFSREFAIFMGAGSRPQ